MEGWDNGSPAWLPCFEVSRDKSFTHDGLQNLCQNTLVIVEGIFLRIAILFMLSHANQGFAFVLFGLHTNFALLLSKLFEVSNVDDGKHRCLLLVN